jgi:hypothetical protein
LSVGGGSSRLCPSFLHAFEEHRISRPIALFLCFLIEPQQQEIIFVEMGSTTSWS